MSVQGWTGSCQADIFVNTVFILIFVKCTMAAIAVDGSGRGFCDCFCYQVQLAALLSLKASHLCLFLLGLDKSLSRFILTTSIISTSHFLQSSKPSQCHTRFQFTSTLLVNVILSSCFHFLLLVYQSTLTLKPSTVGCCEYGFGISILMLPLLVLKRGFCSKMRKF